MSQHSLTRVELHGATKKSEYDGLHKEMEVHGFLRTVKKSGKKYHLPTATYHKAVPDTESPVELMKQVMRIVGAYWQKPRSYEAITSIGPIAIHNLKPV